MTVLFWVVIGCAILIILAGVYTFFQACFRQKEIPWLDDETVKKTKYAKYINTFHTSERWLRDHNAMDIYTVSRDGLKLHAYWIPAENPRATVLLAHGYRSTFLLDFGLAFGFYHGLGINILVVSQRAHGMSEGRFITFGVKESEDMKCWIEYHNRHFGKHPMILSGLSMGASTVLYLADQNLPPNVKCIVADCGFTSPKEIIGQVLRKMLRLPSAPILWVADLCARMISDFSLIQKDTRNVLRNAKLPVFLIHGTDDDFVPCEMTRQAYAVCAGEKELLLVENAGHGTSFLVDRQTYQKRIIAFIKKNIENIGSE